MLIPKVLASSRRAELREIFVARDPTDRRDLESGAFIMRIKYAHSMSPVKCSRCLSAIFGTAFDNCLRRRARGFHRIRRDILPPPQKLDLFSVKKQMAAWSTEIANEFIRLALFDERPLDQMQLQQLVYIAHGWCLAATDQPLTGDRPEAMPHGPEYRQLAVALAACGINPVIREIPEHALWPGGLSSGKKETNGSILDQFDRDWVCRIYREYGDLAAAQLAPLTRREHTPWKALSARGDSGPNEISHGMIRAQFVELAKKFGRSSGS
jgi:uncharacterized phage-associated protein